MGKYRFRLSDMIPNAWFYKLKDMGKARNHGKNTAAAAAAAATGVKQPVKKKQLSSPSPTQPTKQKQSPQYYQYPRKSHYFTRELSPSGKFHQSPSKSPCLDPPRKSSKQKRLRKRTNKTGDPKLVTSSVAAGCSCRATIWANNKPDSPSDYSCNSPLDISPDLDPPLYEENRSDRGLVTESFDDMVAWSNSCSCKVNADDDNTTTKDITIDKDFDKVNEIDGLSDFELPPIVTKVKETAVKKKQRNETMPYKRSTTKIKETKANGSSLSIKVVKEEQIKGKKSSNSGGSPVRKSTSMNSPGVKLRINTPRIVSRKIQGHYGKRNSSSSSSSSRKSLSDSFAIVKSSFDPRKDFKESMVEMIVENNIRASKDLEDLLAIYLSLNSDEYHELIIKVFKQIWFDLTAVSSK